MFKPVSETIQKQLDNPKINTVKLHGNILEPLHIKRSVKFRGDAILSAPLLIENGLEVVFENVTLKIDDWNGQIGITDSYTGNLIIKSTSVTYAPKLIKTYEIHANKGDDIGALVVSNASNSSIEIHDSNLLTASLAAKSLHIHNSTVGYLFGSLSGFYGDAIDVHDSSLSNFEMTGNVSLNNIKTTGDLKLYNLTLPAEIHNVVVERVPVSEKSGDMLPLQSHALAIYKIINRLSDDIVINLFTISGEAKIDGVVFNEEVSHLIDKYQYGLAFINVISGNVSVANSENDANLEYVSVTNGDLKIMDVFNEDVSIIGDGHISKMQSQLPDGSSDLSQHSNTALADLNNMIGLDSVKSQVKKIIASATMRRQRGQSMPALHMVFSGNAGTGKTTVAETVARALFENGVINSSTVVKATKKDLVAGYVGQTAEKTRQVVEKAYGGVLFIDEAYTLTSDSSSNGFEAEAIGELIAQMENHRDNLIVILAGYTDEMKTFMESNQGLNSRFKTWIEFGDYDAEELTKISMSQLKHNGVKLYKSDAVNIMKLMTYFVSHHMNDGNGRFARNFTDLLVENRDVRMFDGSDIDKLTKDDYMAALNSIKKRNALVNKQII